MENLISKDKNLTTKEKLNCKDYQGAARVVDYWNKEDEEFTSNLNEVSKTYVWRAGAVRFRIVRRVSWEELIYPIQHQKWFEKRGMRKTKNK